MRHKAPLLRRISTTSKKAHPITNGASIWRNRVKRLPSGNGIIFAYPK